MKRSVVETISQRRYQILLHSCIYCKLNSSVISDHEYDAFAKELAELQIKYPQDSKNARYYEEFKNWNTDYPKNFNPSGYDLDYNTPKIIAKAEWSLDYNEKKRLTK